jgi:hypothetical protein
MYLGNIFHWDLRRFTRGPHTHCVKTSFILYTINGYKYNNHMYTYNYKPMFDDEFPFH